MPRRGWDAWEISNCPPPDHVTWRWRCGPSAWPGTSGSCRNSLAWRACCCRPWRRCPVPLCPLRLIDKMSYYRAAGQMAFLCIGGWMQHSSKRQGNKHFWSNTAIRLIHHYYLLSAGCSIELGETTATWEIQLHCALENNQKLISFYISMIRLIYSWKHESGIEEEICIYLWFRWVWRRGRRLAGRFPCRRWDWVRVSCAAGNSPRPCKPKVLKYDTIQT